LKLLGHPTPLLHALHNAITATKAKSFNTNWDFLEFILKMCLILKRCLS